MLIINIQIKFLELISISHTQTECKIFELLNH